MQDAGEGRADGFGDSVGLMGTWQVCPYFILKTHALYFICFSPASCGGSESEKSSEKSLFPRNFCIHNFIYPFESVSRMAL